jgi:hypothetical protein
MDMKAATVQNAAASIFLNALKAILGKILNATFTAAP